MYMQHGLLHPRTTPQVISQLETVYVQVTQQEEDADQVSIVLKEVTCPLPVKKAIIVVHLVSV